MKLGLTNKDFQTNILARFLVNFVCLNYYEVHWLLLWCGGERLTDQEVDQILKYTGTEEDLDGNIKYEGETKNRGGSRCA
jgi:hypothetical protein